MRYDALDHFNCGVVDITLISLSCARLLRYVYSELVWIIDQGIYFRCSLLQ